MYNRNYWNQNEYPYQHYAHPTQPPFNGVNLMYGLSPMNGIGDIHPYSPFNPMNGFDPKNNGLPNNGPNNYQYSYGLKNSQQSNLLSYLDDPLYPIHDEHYYDDSQLNGMYPFQHFAPPPRPNGMNYFLHSFMDQKGNFDVNKMVSTAGQLMGIANQVTGLFKGITSMFKA